MPHAKIIFSWAPFIQYEQFLLNKNFRQYIKTMIFKNLKDGNTKISPAKNIGNAYRKQQHKCWTFLERIENSTGSKYHLFMTKVTNT